MSKRTIGFLLTLLGALAVIGEIWKIDFPTARWFFETSRQLPALSYKGTGQVFLWFGWIASFALIAFGLFLLFASFTSGPLNPAHARRIKRFKEIKRGYYSLIILYALVALAALDQVIVGNEALAVRYKGEWTFPAFSQQTYTGKHFGISGEGENSPVNYRALKKKLKLEKKITHGRVIMPLIPYASTGDTLKPRSRALVQRNGLYYEASSRSPYFGLAAKYHDVDDATFHLRYTLRNGRLNGPVDGWNQSGERVYAAEYKYAKATSETYSGSGSLEDFLNLESSELRAVKYHPAPPILEQGNLLGTTSQGYDVLAYLYGGLQVNFKAAIIYLPIVYLIGITLGMLMGYLGGFFDLTMDRFIEVFSNMPFLFVVIILSSMVPEAFKGLPIILTILIIFGWMGITALMRTAAYRDKERDYIAASRVLGASTPRIIVRHLLPNTVAIIVTLIPFTLSSLILSLTSLDYLGFGLPAEYSTWGRLLSDGLSNLSAPWLVTSTFTVLVGQLVLITFIGEAVREAFDPKKHSYYK